jgi:hypothetical protein
MIEISLEALGMTRLGSIALPSTRGEHSPLLSAEAEVVDEEVVAVLVRDGPVLALALCPSTASLLSSTPAHSIPVLLCFSCTIPRETRLTQSERKTNLASLWSSGCGRPDIMSM